MTTALNPIACVEQVIRCDNARDEAGYRALLHDDYRSFVHGQPSTTGADEEVAALATWWKSASDVHLESLAIYESDGVVTLRYRLEGTHDGELFGKPASGKRFSVENCTLLEVVDGKVKQVWRFSDTLGLMTQFGLLELPGA
jgi:limonene-1,2-epoxide hydrolase